MKPKMEKLKSYDYETTESGARTVTWAGMAKRERNLYKLQSYHRPILKKFLESLGYEIVKEHRESDGWGDGFKIDFFEVADKRNGEVLKLTGCDDNTALYEIYKSGGKGLWETVPNTTAWHKMEAEQ